MRMLFDRGEDGVVPTGLAAGAVPIGGEVVRWCSRLLGYAALAAACVGASTIFF